MDTDDNNPPDNDNWHTDITLTGIRMSFHAPLRPYTFIHRTSHSYFPSGLHFPYQLGKHLGHLAQQIVTIPKLPQTASE